MMQLFEFSIILKLITLKSWGIVGVKSGVFNLTSGSQLFRGILLGIQLLHLHPTSLKSVFFHFQHFCIDMHTKGEFSLLSFFIDTTTTVSESLQRKNNFERFRYFIFFIICISVCVQKNGLNYSGCCEYKVTKYSEVYFI